MQQHVGVAVADRLPVVGNVDPAQPQRPARPQPMRIVSDSNSHSVRGVVSLCWSSSDFDAADYTEQRAG